MEGSLIVRDFHFLQMKLSKYACLNKELELEIERSLDRQIVSQEIMSIVQNNSFVDTLNLQTELDRMKERTIYNNARLRAQLFDKVSNKKTLQRYKMVFVPFTRIDNHNRSVTFGAGLLSDETVRSYKWLLQSFKKAFLTDPQVVVTDQDPSMKQAIEVGSSASIMDDFNLGEHKWLCDLYDMRHRWILACLRDEDMSRLMRTTSMSESKNRYFNRFTNPDLTLVEFIGHFESLEKEDAELFTLNIFYEIQDEIVASIAKCLCCILHLIPYLLAHEDDDNLWVDTSAFACESSSSVGIRAIRRIVEDNVDRLVPFKDKLDFYCS
ncbi:FAR1-related sequence 5-like protein [Tanacetum coccineum]